MAKEVLPMKDFNRTIVIEYQLPSGTRVNFRQIGFALSRMGYVMYFTFNEHQRTLSFFLNVPSTMYGKPMCLEWIWERLSFVSTWSPIQVRVYDYIQNDIELMRLFPVQIQPNLMGYSFVDAVHKARPSLDEITAFQKEQMKKLPTKQ
jgi:hypothetical protein